MNYFPILLIFATLLTAGALFLVLKLGKRDNFLKRQGGLVVALVSLLGISFLYFSGNIFGILSKDYWSILLAGLIMVGGGIIDDRFDLKPGWQFVYQAAAALVLLLAGDTINHVRLPLWGVIDLPAWLNYSLSFTWIVLVINAFNWLDGLDGLAGGVGLIGILILFFLSLTPLVSQPQTAAVAIWTAGALLGFLFFNFHPARIYLGSTGSGFVGLMLALLALYSGGKVATTALVLGMPILDFWHVIFWRVKTGVFPWQGGDRRHLHYRLLDAGMSERKIVFLIYVLSGLLGGMALGLQTGGKLILGTGLVFAFGVMVWGLEKLRKSYGK